MEKFRPTLAVMAGCGGRAQIVALLALSACAGAGEGEGGPVGTWGLVAPGGCVVGLGVGDSGRYRFGQVCDLAGGGVGAEIEEGDWTAESSVLRLFPDTVSCQRSQVPWSAAYDITGAGLLRLEGADGVLIFEPIPSDGSSGAYAYGCWDGDTFTPGQLEQVR